MKKKVIYKVTNKYSIDTFDKSQMEYLITLI